jgi:hypothetical protein
VFSSPEKQVANGVVEFFSAVTDEYGSINLSMALPRDSSQSPDIFFYLVHENDRICYARMNFHELRSRGWGSAPQWIYLKEDKLFDKLADDVFPGAVLLGLRVGPGKDVPQTVLPSARPLLAPITSINPDELKSEGKEIPPALQEQEVPSPTGSPTGPGPAGADLKEEKSAPPTLVEEESETASKSHEIGNFTVEVVQAKELPALDKNSKSDPYVKITVGSKSWKTKTKVCVVFIMSSTDLLCLGKGVESCMERNIFFQ